MAGNHVIEALAEFRIAEEIALCAPTERSAGQKKSATQKFTVRKAQECKAERRKNRQSGIALIAGLFLLYPQTSYEVLHYAHVFLRGGEWGG